MAEQATLSVVFFDCDGVLLESSAIKTQAFADLFVDHPAHVDDIVALHVREGGWSRYRKIDLIYRDILGLPLSAEVRAQRGARYGGLVLDALLACDIVPGVPEAFDAIPAGVPKVVVSGSPQDELASVLDQRGLSQHFDELIGSPTEKPDAIRRWLAHLRAEPASAVLVGDAWSDYRSAAETGTRFVGRVPRGDHDPFPAGTVVVEDLCDLGVALVEARVPRDGVAEGEG